MEQRAAGPDAAQGLRDVWRGGQARGVGERAGEEEVVVEGRAEGAGPAFRSGEDLLRALVGEGEVDVVAVESEEGVAGGVLGPGYGVWEAVAGEVRGG